VAPFLASVARAREGILNRLTASLLREDVAGCASDSRGWRIDSTHAADGPSKDAHQRGSLEGFPGAPGLETGKVLKTIPISEGEYLSVPVGGSYAFGRLEVEGPILHVRAGGVRRVRHAVELLRLVRRKEMAPNGATRSSWSRFAEELKNGSANLALALAYQEEKKKRLRDAASRCGVETALDMVLARKARDEDFDGGLFFEQLCAEGHNLHPGAKTKLGMEPEAVYGYAPEFEGAPDVRLVGIRRDRAEWAAVGKEDPGELLFREHPGLRERVGAEFAQKDLSMADYLFVPVHPWQLERAVPRIYREEVDRGIVAPVENVSVPCFATSSFRTVVPCVGGRRGRLAIKTSVDSLMTSTVRSISPNTTNNAPEFSKLILAVMRREPELAETFVPVCEVAGIDFEADAAEGDPGARTAKSRNLSAVLREDVDSFVGRDELAIVGTALYAESPLTGKPILAELVEAYARSTEARSPREAAYRFFSEYAAMVLPGFLTLMVKYGIGLEGHLQNSVPVFKDGRPVRLLFRDWGGARIYRERLERRGLSVDFYPGSLTVTDDPKEMRNKVFYAVFQNHMGEIVLQACKGFGLSERELWREVSRLTNETFDRLASSPEHERDAAQDREALYKANVDHKALTRMRLAPEGGDRYAPVANPLHKFRPGERSTSLWHE
jgi:siderophore synthetase component